MYLKYELEDHLPYLYYLPFHKTSSAEFYSDDGLEHNLPSIGPIPSGCYAGLGRLRHKNDVGAMQAKVNFPLFIEGGYKFKEPDSVHTGYYVEIPVVFNTDLMTRYQYRISHHDGEDIVNHDWPNTAWDNFYGLPAGNFDPDVHGGNYFELIDVTSDKQNPGILYILYPYEGPLPTDPDYNPEYFYAGAHLSTDVPVGGSSPQRFELGQCVRKIARDQPAGNYTSYLKLSVVRDTDADGQIDQIDGYKHVVYDMLNMSGSSQVEGLHVRVTLTTPLDRPLTFTLDVEPAFSTVDAQSLMDSIPRLESEFGLVNHQDLIMSITPTPAGIPGTEFNPISQQVTIPAGSLQALVPVTMKRPVNGRYSIMARVHSFDSRQDLQVLNNDLMLTSKMHSSSAYDDNQMLFRVTASIYKNGLRISKIPLNGTDTISLPAGVEYEVDFHVEYFDKIRAQFKFQLNQSLSVSDTYLPTKHHKYYINVEADGDTRSYVEPLDKPSRTVPQMIMTDGTYSHSKFILPASETAGKVDFNLDFGYTSLIKNNRINGDPRLSFTINLT